MPDFPWQRLPFDKAISYFRDKLNIDTDAWADTMGLDLDAAFVVAGAKGAILQDLRDAVDKAIADGTGLQEFKRDFKAIVAARGWDHKSDRDWRSYLIYDTNMRTAYAAGRWEQIQAVKAQRPYLQWRHGGSRDPRPLHIALDGKVFPVDDPFWQTIGNPPCGFGCRCQVFSLSDRDLTRLNLEPEDGPKLGSDYKGIPVEPDPGWGGGHGRSTPESRAKLLDIVTANLGPELARQVREDAGKIADRAK
jgi:SPP1 gp7 family putative phage head morphogenesis protein